MKLDRNLNAGGQGKYELKNLRTGEIVTDCGPGDEHEFFVIMVRDINAQSGLYGYANSAYATGDEEWADEVREMANRAGPNSPFCKIPD